MIRAIISEDGPVIPCSVVLDGEYNQRDMSMSVPVILGKSGVQKILEYDLNEDEQEGLRVTVDTLKGAAAVVRDCLAKT